jgi:hypothetical protein
MQEHCNKIVLGPVVVINPEVEVEVAAELAIDVGKAGSQFSARTLVSKRRKIPGSREFCSGKETNTGEVAEKGSGSSAPQDVRAKGVEGRLNGNRYIAVEGCSPNAGRVIEGIYTLLAEGRAGVATYRGRWRGIIESLTWTI